MFSLYKLFHVFERQLSSVEIQQDVCNRIISTSSTCTSCIDRCPSNSIRITKSDIELTDCLECGICGVVCPTSAFSWKRPSFNQMLTQMEQLYEEEGQVILYCSKVTYPQSQVAGMKVPCLGAIPWEIWTCFLTVYPKITVFLPEGSCQSCSISTGEKVWKEQLNQAERFTKRTASISDKVMKIQREELYDASRRRFFQSVLREAKQTGKEIVKEYLGETKRPDHKRLSIEGPENVVSRITEEFKQTKTAFVEKLLKESRYSYVAKRNILLQLLITQQHLQQEIIVKLPEINESCDLCGACTHLCPTQAITMQESKEGGAQEIWLHPAMCVECGLCEEICWDKSIHLIEQPAEFLLQSAICLVN